MAHSIQDFKKALKGGGSRANLFEVAIPSLPDGVDFGGTDGQDNFSMLCKAAALPASNIGSIDVPFRGRIMKVAGDRTYDTWSVTVINDEDFAIRNAMETWMQVIGQYGDGSGTTNPESYMVDAYVKQFKRSASATGFNSPVGGGLEASALYKFYSVFPTNVSAIDVSYDSSDTIEEFTVDFQVQYWTPQGAQEAYQ